MKNILLLCEKPSLLRELLSQYKQNNNTYFENNYVHVCFCNPVSVPIYKYPTDIKYKDYPKSNPVELKWNDNFSKMNFHREGSPSNIHYISSKEDFRTGKFDELLVLQDRDYIGAYYAVSILEFVYGKDFQSRFSKATYLPFYNFSTFYQEVEKNLKCSSNEFKEQFFKLARAGMVKQYFQFNFNFNSMIFFKEILQNIGINNNINISKNMLILMHILYNPKYNKKFNLDFLNFNVRTVDLLIFMENYKGSGKFVNVSEYTTLSLGSPATKDKILENLLNLKLISNIQIKKLNFVVPTEKGKLFFQHLNNKTFDIDMPFRLNDWQNIVFDGNENVNNIIDSYIYNFFIGQKRKNNKSIVN